MSINKHTLKNGMVVLGEQMPSVESVAFGFMLPAGASRLPDGCCGAANIIEDWMFRGAGDMDSRILSDALDSLGLHRIAAVGPAFLTIGSALEADNLSAALELYAKIIRQPRFDNEQFELSKQLTAHGILGLDDEPRQKVILKLREQFYPQPLGRSTAGELDQLNTLTADKTRSLAKDYIDLSQSIFSLAGKFDFETVCKLLENLFDTKTQNASPQVEMPETGSKYTHIENDGAQVHIGLMVPAVTPNSDDFYNARLAIAVLSGGMSSRLFTEVREKRGLCYAVGAKYHGLKQAAGIMCYAGTDPDKAQHTYDVTIEEFNKLKDGIDVDELERAKVGLKSSLIMSSESSSSRAGGIGSDYYLLDRVRSLDEIKERIEHTTVDSVLKYLSDNPFSDFTVVTIGPKQINI